MSTENVVLVAPQKLPADYGHTPSFATITYADLVGLSDRLDAERQETGLFIMSPRVARRYRFFDAEIQRELRLAAKRRRRVRTRGHGGRRR